MAPHGDDDDEWVPPSLSQAGDRDVSFDSVEECFQVPQDSSVVGLSEGYGFGDSVPFVSSTHKAPPFYCSIPRVGDGLVVLTINWVENTT